MAWTREEIAKRAALGRKYDAVICLGAVIRGSTPHFDYVSSEVSKGVAAASMEADVPVIFASGDTVWKDGKAFQDLANMVNIMGRMEYMKFLAGCSAALTTKTGQIGFLGPLINDETRRLAASAFLGAKYCWTTYAKKNAADLKFKVTWIGFWFNIPGTTLDPTQVANDFFNSGYDVVISGIDTTEALVQANKAEQAGKQVWAVSYDFKDGCAEAPNACLGVPYFNWGPWYVKYFQQIIGGTFKQAFEWAGPDWKNIDNPVNRLSCVVSVESRQNQMQRMRATISAIQLRPIGIVSVPTVTWAWFINRSRWPIAKIPKRTLATRSPVLGEFMSHL